MTKRAMSTGGYPIEVMTPTDPGNNPGSHHISNRRR